MTNFQKIITDIVNKDPQKQAGVAEKLGVTDAYVSNFVTGIRPISSKIAKKMEEIYGLDATQLLAIKKREEADLLLPMKTSKSKNTNDIPLRKSPFSELQDKWERQENYMIPLYDDVSTFGGNVEQDLIAVSHPTEFINAGSWFGKTKITAAIRHYGESMIEYPNGCILAIKEITDFDNVVYGRNYVLETQEIRVTKRVQSGKDEHHITAYSTNTETYPDGKQIHEPFSIKKSKIKKISLVIGRIVKEHSSGEIITT